MRINLTSFLGIVLIYAVFIAGALIYFVGLQQFGYHGFRFAMEGKDRTLTHLDIAIIVAFVVSFVLLMISLFAFGRKKTVKIFIISMVFFFFTIKEFLITLENFFPEENIYIGNATGALELLILVSFVLLIYNIYRPQK